MPLDILVVDDEADIRNLVAGVLEDEGYSPRTAADADSALAAFADRRPSLIILDIWLQGSRLDGLELLDAIKARDPSVPVLIISGHGNLDTAVAAIKRGAYDFIEKPFQADVLLQGVGRATETERLRREVSELRDRAGLDVDLTGTSQAINSVRATIRRVGATGSRVLISGPAGSGKEVAARLLHQWSQRASRPFIVVAAARMEPDRMEEELFGREENGDLLRTGLLEQADGGTLFIDEVADMPPTTQAKILRVLRSKAFSASAAPATSAPTCGSSAPRHAIFPPRSPGAASAKTFTTASTSCPSACRRFPRGARTSARSLNGSSRDSQPNAGSRRPSSQRTRWRRCRRTTGRAMSVSSAMSSNAP
jgi:two-component system nitrogen regulation response regulator NtrX